MPIHSYGQVTQGRPLEYRARLWELSEKLLQGHLSRWPF